MYKKIKITLGVFTAGIMLSGSVALPTQAAGSQSIVFASNRDGNLEIYASERDGNNVRRLTNSTNDDKEPAASPDGKRVVFASTDDPDDFEEALVLLDMRTQQQTQLTSSNKHDYRNPVWSPDGTKIAFTSISTEGPYESCINVMVVQTKQLQKVICAGVWLGNPDWSPDGTKLLYSEFYRPTGGKMYSVQAQTGADKQFIGNGSAAVFSPKGDQIAFSAYDADYISQIFVAKVDGSMARQITTGAEIKTVADWAQDGYITYSGIVLGETPLQVRSIKSDGTGVIALPPKGTSFDLPGNGLLVNS
ncbi:MAG TPA: hypothetical protein VM581_02645 [Magnetospirillaceae bacterium]|nr:hypothetical protein [Magnetospirillaceae bacterium]